MKIVTYNIRRAYGQDGICNIDRIVGVLKGIDADVIALQEVDHLTKRSDLIDQTSFLSKKLEMEGLFASFMELEGGEYGMAMLSKYPILRKEVIPLPPAIYEPRVAISMQLKLPDGKELAVINVHLDWPVEREENRVVQMEALIKTINSINCPVVVMGDFNALKDSDSIKLLLENGFTNIGKGDIECTFLGSEDQSPMEIDHIMYRMTSECSLKVNSIDLLDERVASDHLPVVAELNILSH